MAFIFPRGKFCWRRPYCEKTWKFPCLRYMFSETYELSMYNKGLTAKTNKLYKLWNFKHIWPYSTTIITRLLSPGCGLLQPYGQQRARSGVTRNASREDRYVPLPLWTAVKRRADREGLPWYRLGPCGRGEISGFPTILCLGQWCVLLFACCTRTYLTY